ncbi:MAG: CHAT domain-containing protein [Cyclobacteriaceae bacterium]|nr:CHAT domain-containing protein [Cyclobacteriaceae bacterium]
MRTILFIFLISPFFSYAQFGKLLDKAASVGLKKGTEMMSDHLRKTREKFDTTSFNYSVSFSDVSAQYEDKEKLDDVTNVASIYLDDEKDKTLLEEAREQIDMGEMYYATNAFNLAEISFLVALGILEIEGDQNNLMYPRVLADIGMLYNGMGRYDLAMEFTTRALESRKELRGENSIDYAASLNNLAVLFKNIGDFNEAESKLNETLKINEQVSGKSSMAYAITLNNRGVLFQNLGRYKEAERDIIECLDVAADNMSTKSLKYARFQTNLGLLYQQQQKYDEAEKIFESAISAVSRNPLKSKKSNPDYAHLLEIKASLYMEIAKYEEAEKLLIEALAVYEKKFGRSFSGNGLTKARLGVLYRSQGMLDKAQNNLKGAEYILGDTYGKTHPFYVQVETELALLNWQKGDIEQADSYFKQSIDQSLKFVSEYFAPMSDMEKAAYWKTLRPRFEKYFAFTAAVGSTNPKVLESAMNYRLATKAMLLSSTTKVKSSILNSGDESLIETYNSWLDNKHQLALYYSMSKEDLTVQNVNTDSIASATNQLEKELSQKSGIFSEAYKSKVPELYDVQSKLKSNEAAVEIIRVGYSLDGNSTKYMALVVKPSEIKMVVLLDGDQLERKYFKYYKNVIKFKRDDAHSYNQFWKPIAKELTGISSIYLSSDGVYNQLSVNSLKNPDGGFVLDGLSILNVSSLRSIVGKSALESSKKTALLVGNPSYGSPEIAPLPGTGKEIEAVSTILKANGFKNMVYQNASATEEIIKEARSPKVLHIATHGFFVKDVKTNNNTVFSVPLNNINDNVLLRSGLLLANAGKLDINAGGNNGVLTAYEAMNLDLTNTDLVVLSACETGLGDIMSGEGVYGLQRSFEVAGAKAVIMSLWKVDDTATQLLMTSFYKNWVASKDKLSSFRKAQMELKASYPEPYYWGAFVMQGE